MAGAAAGAETGGVGRHGAPPIQGSEIKDILARCSLRGECFPLRDFAAANGASGSSGRGGGEGEGEGDGPSGWLFYATQVSRSVAESDIYQTWSQLAEEELDEDLLL